MDGFDADRSRSLSSPCGDVAIIGAACRLPGAADLDRFADLLSAGADAVTEIPDDRFCKSLFLHPVRGERGRAYTFAAGVIDDPYHFDPAAFGISPREAVQMDPQQRLLLELAHEAFEDAGIIPSRLGGSEVGVYVGGSAWDYLTTHVDDVAVTDGYSMTGATLCSLANRISYVFDLRGPSLTVDTACSSSLAALHLACETIRNGRAAMAVVGGVNLLLAPQSFIGFCQASMLSPTGRCHAFGDLADGYVRAEGGGVVVLKPLAAALAAGDPIRAVVRGTGVNSDGRTNGFSVPSPRAQASLLREVYGRFEISPRSLAYVEAHGTGTPVGDPIEAAALGRVLGAERDATLPIGSVKTNIGHLEAGSGMAGLFKAMLVAGERVIPASLHAQAPNPAIPFEQLRLRLVTAPESIEPGGPNLVGVNSFGFGGTNAHAVIGPAPVRTEPNAAPIADSTRALPPLLLSAHGAAALRALAASWLDRLNGPECELPGLIRGAARAREQHPARVAVVGGTARDMHDGLAAVAEGRDDGRVTSGAALDDGRVAFVFGGNGSQWAGMAQDEIRLSPAFRRGLDEVDEALAPQTGWSVRSRLRAGVDDAALAGAAVAQPLLFAVQVASVLALRHHGVRPCAHLGHSVGEIAAAWASGALDLAQAARLAAVRSREQQRLHGNGGMAVLALGADEALAALATLDDDLELAADNASRSVTVAGPADALARLEAQAALRGWGFKRLDLAYGFHSALMEPMRGRLLAELADLAPMPCSEPFVSSVTGARLAGDALDSAYWWSNVRSPVRFAQAARVLASDGVRLFLEISPQPVLQAYLADALSSHQPDGPDAARIFSAMSRRPARHDPTALTAARLHVSGHDVTGAPAFEGPVARQGLPRYPWQREEFRMQPSVEATGMLDAVQDHPLLGFRLGREPDGWLACIDVASQPWLAGHVVGGGPVLPAAAVIDMALAAGRARLPQAAGIELRDLVIRRPLVLDGPGGQSVRTRATAGDRLEIACRARLSESAWTTHASVRVSALECVRPTAGPFAEATSSVSREEHYEAAGKLGLRYAAPFRSVTAVDLCGADRAVVHLALPSGRRRHGGSLIDPALLDGALQGVLPMAAARLGLSADDAERTVILPGRFGRVRLHEAAGADPVAARLHLRRVGPRAVCADITLLDADGAVCAELSDCWFTRVSRPRQRSVNKISAHVRFALSDDGGADGRTADVAQAALASAAAGPGDRSAELADAFIAAAAAEAIAQLPDAERDGGAPAVRQALGWLEQDGLAEQGDHGWRLLPDVLGATADAILTTLIYEHRAAAADAALLAEEADALGSAFRGERRGAEPVRELLDAFLHASPAGARALGALCDAAAAAARAWPRDRPLRVIEIGARHGAVSRSVLRSLRAAHPEVAYRAVADAGDLPLVAAALAGFPDAEAVLSDRAGSDRAGSAGLVVGLHALTFGGPDAAAAIRAAVSHDGAAILVEALPNRVWDFLRLAPEGGLRPSQAWTAALEEAGLARPATCPLPLSLWPACLLVAAAPPAAAPEPVRADGGVVLAGAPDDVVVASLARRLAGAGMSVQVIQPEALGAGDADDDAPLALVLPDLAESGLSGAACEWLALLARLPVTLSARRAPLLVIARGDVRRHGPTDPFVAAILGLRRVLANESPHLRCRVLVCARDLAPEAAAAQALREIVRAGDDGEISWNGAFRRVARAVPGLPLPDPVEPVPSQLVVDRPGRLDTLRFAPLAPRPLQAQEVAIDVRAAALNFRDVMWAMGMLPDEALLDGFAGATLGLECAGVVSAVGADVQGLAVGQRVMALAPAALATVAVTRAQAVVPLPDDMDFIDGATVPVAFLTAAYALGRLADVQAGERVLIHGAAGAVGIAALQYARQRGAVCLATAGSAAKRALLRRLGAAHVFDSRSLRFADDVMAVTGGAGVDVVLNSLSGEAMERSISLLAPFGRFLELGKRDFHEDTAIGLRPLRHNAAYHAVDVDQLPLRRPGLAASLMAEVVRLMNEGALRPLPRRVFAFGEAAAAFRLMQASGHIGKIVLERDEDPQTRPEPSFAADAAGTYLVVGGLSGFGLEAARWLVRRGARHLALMGRRGPTTPGAAEATSALRAAGATCAVVQCDAADEAALASALRKIRFDMPPIAGVVQAAMVLDDAMLPALDAARFRAALRPKWAATDLLDRLTREDPVSLFLMFSSLSALVGGPGQGSYAAANAAMEAIARRRNAAGLPALAVGFGPIGDAGVLARDKATAQTLERRLGAQPLAAAEALDAVPSLLASGLPVVTLAAVDWGLARNRLPLLSSPLFAAFAESPKVATETDLHDLLASRPAEDARAEVSRQLADEVGKILQLSSDRVGWSRPLVDLGMDSLMAVELRLAAEARFGVALPPFGLSEETTVGGLAALVIRAALPGQAAGAPDATDPRVSRYEDGLTAQAAAAQPDGRIAEAVCAA